MQTDVASGNTEGVGTTLKPFQFRGRFLTALALRLSTAPDARFYEMLADRLEKTPNFFTDAPVIIDLEQSQAEVSAEALTELVADLRRRDLAVFGIQGGGETLKEAAAGLGLITVTGGRDAPLRGALPSSEQKRPQRVIPERARPEPTPAPEAAPEPQPAPEPVRMAPENKIVTMPVRSGQTVIADKGDLTVVGPVSSGAELFAAGNIHVYGRMRGRAFAGIDGDENARIFCQSLDAELLAIAGLYRTSDSLGADVRHKMVQIYLEDERLIVSPFA
ncbi:MULTISPECIES: septum site-determining protein MinC [Roseobacteraceae]|uniref:septum site-determining protein MinC n=1 Tax=Roseobacteraceae TaxID=2854170 RepID=UPI00080AB20A|nr:MULTISPECIES: septum site-determining protein MinC [Roseobacteraceae]ANT61040.1 septum site-determining protein MinC [Salipiger sp. CCB-MM3]MCA0994262.1 septum site-determining protein MinC [Alloyangia pacifica]